MGDALCGPSNAFQNFQKHASVDRSLQQDRRILQRDHSHNGFRSAQGPSSSSLDHEFNAFQAGFDVATDNNYSRDLPVQGLRASFQPAVSQPMWAADFQRLNLSAPPPYTQASSSLHTQRMTPAQDTTSWHLDFLKLAPPPTSNPISRPTMYTSAFHPMRSLSSIDPNRIIETKQTVSSGADDAAFARAFDAAQANLAESSAIAGQSLQQQEEMIARDRIPEETNPLMRMTWEKQPATYLVVKLWNAFGLSTDGTPFHQDTVQNASAFMNELERLQANNNLTDEEELQRTRKILRRILQLEQIPEDTQFQFTERARRLLEQVEATLAVSPQGLSDQDSLQLENHQIISQIRSDDQSLHSEGTQKEESIPQESATNDEELARTAAQLLDSVSDNTSQKFQESNFLALMRKLRDREVRVEGDKMVPNLTSDEMNDHYIPQDEQDSDLGRKPLTGVSWNEDLADEPFA